MSQTSVSNTHAAAFEGMLADSGESDIISRISSESSVEIPFGVVVAEDSSGDALAKLPTATNFVPAGLVLHSHAYDKSADLGSVGLKPKAVMNVLRKGRAYVKVEEAVSKGDRGFVRFSSGSGGTQLGAIRKSDDTSTAADCTSQIVFLSAASAGGIVLAEFDFTNKK